jgi:caffeoyl-CoA O-methyltransferase
MRAMAEPKSFHLSADIHAYLMAHSTAIDEIQADLIAETAEATGGFAGMQISPEQGIFMTLLTRAIGAREAVEVGTFTGYSSLAVARGLPEDGHLLCCDVSEEWTAIARRYWDRAGVADRITLAIGPAGDTLAALAPEPQFDLAFIDADKTGYARYFAELVPRLRPGGLILVDNVLWSGRIIDPTDTSDDTEALRAFNDQVVADDRVDVVMLAVSDGLSIIAKR